MNDSSKLIGLILKQRTIHPNDILYALFLARVSPRQIATECNVTPQTVSLVIHRHRKSTRVANYIAEKLNTSTERLWPGAYNYNPRNSTDLRSVANG